MCSAFCVLFSSHTLISSIADENVRNSGVNIQKTVDVQREGRSGGAWEWPLCSTAARLAGFKVAGNDARALYGRASTSMINFQGKRDLLDTS